MKNHFLHYFGIIAFLLFSNLSLSQSTFQITNIYSDTTSYYSPCDSAYSIAVAVDSFPNANADRLVMITGANFTPGTLNATVNWGDGNTSTHTGQMNGQGQMINFQPSLWHFYNSQSGTYNISLSLTNPDNSSTISETLPFTHRNCSAYFVGSTSVDCDNNGSIDSNSTSYPVIYDFSGPNGGTQQVYLYQNGFWANNMAHGDVYTYTLNQTWLNNNNYVQTSPAQTITISSQNQISSSVRCDSVPTQTYYDIYGMYDTSWVAADCDSHLTIGLYTEYINSSTNDDIQLVSQGNNYVAGPLTLVINWGDGTTTTHTGNSGNVGTEVNFQPQLAHNYQSGAGTYSLTATLTNPNNNSSASATFSHTITTCGGNFIGIVEKDCNNDSIVESTYQSAVFDFADNQGNVHQRTLYPNQSVNVNLPQGVYQISLNNNWRNNNGQVMSQWVNPSTVQIGSTGGVQTISARVNCPATFSSNVNFDCNNDGNIDSVAAVLMDFTDSQGNVSSHWIFTGTPHVLYNTNFNPGIYTMNINSQWLTGRGMLQFSLSPSTINIAAGGAYTFNGTVICDSTPPSNNCVQGLIFCDNNGDGIWNNGDTGIDNAPVQVSFDGQSFNGTSNGGQFYMNLPNGNSNGATVTINSQWLAQNGYYLPNNIDTVMNVNCSQSMDTVIFAVDCDSSNVQTECVYGVVFCDANGNGYQDSSEMGLPNAPIQLTALNGTITVFTNQNGYFDYSGTFFGSSTVVAQVSATWMAQHGYIGNTVQTVSTDCQNQSVVYMPVDCGSGPLCSDMWTAVTSWSGYFQNQNNYVKLKWGTNGSVAPGSYILELVFPAGVTVNTNTINNQNYVINGNTITWTFTNVTASYINFSDVISFFVPAGFPSGTPHSYTATITSTGNTVDCNPLNNTGTLLMILGNSYDPNDKNVNQPMYIDPYSEQTMDYTIRFQNTGDAPAQDIYIIDTLSENLDWSTFELLSASHDMKVIDLGNGVLRFDFPGIWLPDSTNNEPESHGELTYRITEKTGNGIGVGISNTAYIYFDWNEAIITNTTYNENNVLSVFENKEFSVSFFPNPVGDELFVKSNEEITSIRMIDITGKVVLSETGSQIEKINCSHLESGTYLLQFETISGQSGTKKLLKE